MSWRKYKYICLGCVTYVPGLHSALRRGTGGTTSARYCYSVWLRHLVLNRLVVGKSVRSVAELGPGDSLGVGLAALLCGAHRYIALDALPHARARTNLAVFEELIELFRQRASIPDDREFPHVYPKLPAYDFPGDLLPDDTLDEALSAHRLEGLRRDLARLDGAIVYRPEWQSAAQPPDASVDLLMSQAVLEHVDAIEDVYRAMFRWLRPGGAMSHQIDFKCHSTAVEWNGHLAYSDFVWRLMRGNLSYFINRQSPSAQIAAAEGAGFTQVSLKRVLREDGLRREQFAPRFRALSELDAKSSGGFLQAIRPPRREQACVG